MAQAAKKKQRQRISPHETITATIDGDELKLVYGRPYTKKPGTDRGPQDLGRAGPLRQGLAHRRRRGHPAHDQGADRDRRLLARRRHVLAVHRPRRGRHRQARHQQEDRPVGRPLQRGSREGQRAGPGRPQEVDPRQDGRPVHDGHRAGRRRRRRAQDDVGEDAVLGPVHREEIEAERPHVVAHFHRGPASVRPRWTSQLRGLLHVRTTTLPRVAPARRWLVASRPGRGPAGRADLAAAAPRSR